LGSLTLVLLPFYEFPILKDKQNVCHPGNACHALAAGNLLYKGAELQLPFLGIFSFKLKCKISGKKVVCPQTFTIIIVKLTTSIFYIGNKIVM
jgi:hypothetical protein